MPSSSPERRLSLAQQLVLDLSRKILAGELPAGSKLPTEQALTLERGVSRTVVREAMSRLQAEGLVETRRGIGTFVVDATGPGDFQGSRDEEGAAFDVVALIELRLSLEIEAAAIAAQRATGAQLQALHAALEQAHALVQASEERTALDFEFHLQIALCTGNSFFIDAMTHMRNTRMTALQHAIFTVTGPQRTWQIREREQIYVAIAHADTEGARAAMRLHLTNCLHQARRAVASNVTSAP